MARNKKFDYYAAFEKQAEIACEAADAVSNSFAEMEERLLLHDLAVVSNRKQYELAEMRLQGYTIAEIAAEQGMKKVRIRRLLKELYRTYLQLCRN